jgi:hypothetical protein
MTSRRASCLLGVAACIAALLGVGDARAAAITQIRIEPRVIRVGAPLPTAHFVVRRRTVLLIYLLRCRSGNACSGALGATTVALTRRAFAPGAHAFPLEALVPKVLPHLAHLTAGRYAVVLGVGRPRAPQVLRTSTFVVRR